MLWCLPCFGVVWVCGVVCLVGCGFVLALVLRYVGVVLFGGFEI